MIFSRVLRDSTPRFVGPSVGPSVRPSAGPSVRHTLLFLGFCVLWPHCSSPSDQVTSNTAPAHPHATGVAVYPALFFWGQVVKLKMMAKLILVRPIDDEYKNWLSFVSFDVLFGAISIKMCCFSADHEH